MKTQPILSVLLSSTIGRVIRPLTNIKGILLLPLLTAAPLAEASPFTARVLPAGFNAARSVVGTTSIRQEPVAADFMGNGRLQWYAGGSVISRFPQAGIISLPVITRVGDPLTPPSYLSSTVCDVDRDGDLDIVRCNGWTSSTYTMQVFLNNGSGTFSLGYRLDWTNSTFVGLVRLIHGDFNGDGAVDLGLTDWGSSGGKFQVRWNDGAGAFPTFTTLQAGELNASTEATAGDYDRDGDLDIFITNRHNNSAGEVGRLDHRIWTNNGTGSFTAASAGPNGTRSLDVKFADLNRDGWPDLADSLTFIPNNRDGTFAAWSDVNSIISGAWLYADLNRDGKLDQVRADGNALAYLPGTGTGDFPWGSPPLNIATFASPVGAVGAADSDADGDTDLFVTLENGTFFFIENTSLHLTPVIYRTGEQAIAGVTQLRKLDYNRDGIDDVLAVTPSQQKLWFLAGKGTITGVPAAGIFKLTGGANPHSAVIADFDRDGQVDVAYTLPSAGQVRLARNSHAIPTLWADTTIATGIPGVGPLETGDYNARDGRTDLLTSSTTTGQVRWLYQTGGTWAGQNVYAAFVPIPGRLMAVEAAAGFAGDEPFSIGNDGSNLFLRGNQQILPSLVPYGTPLLETVTAGPLSSVMLWADHNADGLEEVVYLGGDGSLRAYQPVSQAQYNIAPATATSPAIRDAVATDWDRDGWTDFICATSKGLQLARVTAAGLRERTDLYSDGVNGYTSVLSMDLNRDGFADIVAADQARGVIEFFVNQPSATSATLLTGAETELPVGKTNAALTFTVRTAGRAAAGTSLADVPAVMTGAQVQFNRANFNNGVWSPGAPLTNAQLSAAVSSIRFQANSTVIGSSGPTTLDAAGQMSVNYHTVLGSLVPVRPGDSITHTIQLDVKPTALSSSTTAFYMTLWYYRAQSQHCCHQGQIGLIL